MRKVALKGLAGRKVRALLTAVAIVLGVAMVSGSFVLTDTISKAFDTIFTSAYDQTDAVVSGKKVVDSSASGNATVDVALLQRIRALPDVDSAAGSVMDIAGSSTTARLIDRNGKVIQQSGNPTFGFGVDPSQPRFNPMKLVSGAWAHGPAQVVIDGESADQHGFKVGDTIRVAANGPARTFTISGLAKYGNVSTLGGATIAVFDIPTAQSLLKIKGYSAISVAAKDGVSQSQLVRDLKQIAPATATVKSGYEQASSDKKSVSSFISLIRGVLLGFGGIALLVGGFVIFNTLSITVAQRTRELATLRTLGASRRQVLRSVVLEALALGTLASVVGIGAGLGLAKGLSALFSVLGLSLPEAAPVYALHTFVVSLLVGIGVTVLAGIAPALRATRVAPIAAVREGAIISKKKRLGPAVGVILFAIATGLIAYAAFDGYIGSTKSLLALASGALLGILGVAGFAQRLVTVLSGVVGLPSRRLGGAAGRLAAENATRNPARTASTAAALMIGLSLVTFVAVLAQGVHNSLDNGVKKQFAADYVLTSSDGWTPLPTAAEGALASVPGIADVSSIRVDRGLVGKAQVNVHAVDPKTLAGLYRFKWTQGSDATLTQLDGHGAILKRSFAKARHLAVGDAFTLRSSALKPIRLHVIGIYQPARVSELLGGVILSHEAFDRTFPRPQNAYTLIRGDVTKPAIERALAAFPAAKVQTQAEFVKNQSSFINKMLNLLYVLLALSVIVSLFGMVNTLVLSVYERTRELGMLRAVGMTRRQTRRMVRHESVITALIGAGLGLPLGVGLAAAVVHALGKYDVAFSLPVSSLVAFTLGAAVVGVLAAIAPARRASRLNVLSALQYE